MRFALFRGAQLPEPCIIDAHGNLTTDPAALYGLQQGALLPLGGAVGHRGTGLAVMYELLGGALSAAGCSGHKMADKGNGLFFEPISIADFVPVEQFIATVQGLTI